MNWTTTLDGPVAVIGDLHGERESLHRLLAKLKARPDFRQRWLVFLGDFVDRGPDSRGVLEDLIELRRSHGKVAPIAGNHDLAMAGALGLVPVPEHCDWGARWVAHYDSAPTFASYGASHGDLTGLASRLPEEHRQLLASLPWCVEHPQWLFVHAGLDPHLDWKTQLRILRERDFTLNRPGWLCNKELARSAPPPGFRGTIVSGHLHVPRVEFSPGRILLDTSGGLGGDLSCVLLPEKIVLASGDSAAESANSPSKTPASQNGEKRSDARRKNAVPQRSPGDARESWLARVWSKLTARR